MALYEFSKTLAISVDAVFSNFVRGNSLVLMIVSKNEAVANSLSSFTPE